VNGPVGERDAWLDALGLVRWVPRTPGTQHTANAAAADHGTAAQASPTTRRGVPQVPELGGVATGQPMGGVATAREVVLDPALMDWDTLRTCVAGCVRCPLHEGRTQTVFGVGDRAADWMIVGEAPGAEEDRRGEPFIGSAGRLLDAMLAAVGRSRQNVFITNVVKCRPPGNRDPAASEAAACSAYLLRQITLQAPKLILAVGRIAGQQLLGSREPLGRLRGRVHAHPALGIPVIVTYHPAYLLRSPADKAGAWQDLLMASRLEAGAAP